MENWYAMAVEGHLLLRQQGTADFVGGVGILCGVFGDVKPISLSRILEPTSMS